MAHSANLSFLLLEVCLAHPAACNRVCQKVMVALGYRKWTATLAGACLLFENSLVLQCRYILLDSFMLSFIMLALYCHCKQQLARQVADSSRVGKRHGPASGGSVVWGRYGQVEIICAPHFLSWTGGSWLLCLHLFVAKGERGVVVHSVGVKSVYGSDRNNCFHCRAALPPPFLLSPSEWQPLLFAPPTLCSHDRLTLAAASSQRDGMGGWLAPALHLPLQCPASMWGCLSSASSGPAQPWNCGTSSASGRAR